MADPKYFLNQTRSQLENDLATLPGNGYQLISFSAHGAVDDPRFTTVWWRPRKFPLQKFYFGDDLMGLNITDIRTATLVDTFTGYIATHVAALGTTPENPRFFVVSELRPGSKTGGYVEFDIELSDLSNRMKALHEEEKTLKWACLYGSFEDPYVAYVFALNPPKGRRGAPAKASATAWSYEPFEVANVLDAANKLNAWKLDDANTLMARLGAYVQGGIRPVLIAPFARRVSGSVTPGTRKHHNPSDEELKTDYLDTHHSQEEKKGQPTVASRFLSIWYDDVIGGWDPEYQIGNWSCAFEGLDDKYFFEQDEKARKSGHWPIRIMGTGQGPDTRFAAIWARQDRPTARKWRVTNLSFASAQGLPPPRGAGAAPDPFLAFNQWMESFMKNRGIRAGQLAIVRGGKLVCARAYRWAEPGFKLDNSSTFRIGSVSKIITAMATWQVMEKNTSIQPTTDIVIAAKLALRLDPGNPTSRLGEIENVNVLHLLTHTSGLMKTWGEPTTVHDYSQKPYPLPLDAFLDYNVNRSAPIKPGTTGVWSYSNLGYVFLSELVRLNAIDKEYVTAIEREIFGPLKILNRPHAGEVAIEDRKRSEVLCQMPIPAVAASLVHEDGRLVYYPYGGAGQVNAGTGSGGWFMAAVDFARILAAFRQGDPYKLYENSATLDGMLLVPPLGFPPSEPPATPGGWAWSYPTMKNGKSDLVLSKGGHLGGGNAYATLWNPSGPPDEVIGIFICFNQEDSGYGPRAVLSFQQFLTNITANLAWPNIDLFSEVINP